MWQLCVLYRFHFSLAFQVFFKLGKLNILDSVKNWLRVGEKDGVHTQSLLKYKIIKHKLAKKQT